MKRYRGILFSSNMLKVYKSEQKEIILSSPMAMIMAMKLAMMIQNNESSGIIKGKCNNMEKTGKNRILS